MDVTAHFLRRATQRRLKLDVYHFIILYGVESSRAGVRFITVLDRALPPDVDRRLLERSRGWVLVMMDNGALITCYRSKDANKKIVRKSRFQDGRHESGSRNMLRGPDA